MERKSFSDMHCSVAQTLEVVGEWWSLLIVRDAFRGLRRFGQFQKSLGLARNILTVRLRALVADGILELVPASDGSAYQEYALTEKGRGLLPVLVALRQWGMAHFPDGGPWGIELVDRHSGQPIRQLELHAEDGRTLTADDMQFRVIPARDST
jgi:DNA-binding HxlR family transcriptional regulator